MGVTGLWTVVQPCARPIKIETLNKKRLAVDASIWIYQFLKAVRDKEGNALRNSHVVGFFRRICKLLFFGIKPVFVFDGGAPALKRQTVSSRKARREGRREDAVRTAGKLLAVQMQRRAEEEEMKRRDAMDRPAQTRRDEDEEEEIPDELVYVDELQMTPQERRQNRQFKKKDAYHLPDLDVSLAEMGAPNDPRIMSQEELEEYARQFHMGEDINLYDFSKIDFNSPFFLSLPASDRYNILNAARLRSRLRMGYSKEQLDTMFPDRMAFSKFQVERVKERNELTQRLMNLNGMNGENAMFGVDGIGRVAGEKGKEYVLVKNDGVEGGWALGVVSNRNEGDRNKPIDVEGFGTQIKAEDDEDEWEDEFEDVPIEGLNRLPKQAPGLRPDTNNYSYDQRSTERAEMRRALYKSRQEAAGIMTSGTVEAVDEDPDSLFLPGGPLFDAAGDNNDEYADDVFEDVTSPSQDEDDEDLQRAIAMSLEDPEQQDTLDGERRKHAAAALNGPRIDRPLEFNQKNAAAGRAVAHLINAKAAKGHSPRPEIEENSSEDDIDFQGALAESRNGRHTSRSPERVHARNAFSPRDGNTSSVLPFVSKPTNTHGFDGPLPFESINLGKSILRKKRAIIEEEEGGFEKEAEKEKAPQPLPPWFTGDIRLETAAPKMVEDRQFDGGDPQRRPNTDSNIPILHHQKTGEVVDLDAPHTTTQEIIEVESSSAEEDDVIVGEIRPVDSEIIMGDIADLIRAEPPVSDIPQSSIQSPTRPMAGSSAEVVPMATDEADEEEESIDWEESDLEIDKVKHGNNVDGSLPAGGILQTGHSRSPSPEFENVGLPDMPTKPQLSMAFPAELNHPALSLAPEDSYDKAPVEDDAPVDDGDFYSDPEDDELMRQLAIEAEEHARFASSLTTKSQLQSAEEYERELRQLRNQQKKDRRDADEVSHVMITECQQLLKLFGLPYITAPMEAEAQCAELVSLGLVDGIVTDDSDIFLFGGTRVYKNLFNQAKYVECYLSSDLEKEYSLDRSKVIQIAHLLGSDYTEGLPSVGPVTALEILSEFESLEAFKEWWTKVQSGQKLPEDGGSAWRRKFKRNAAKLFLPPTFPDKRVDEAYLHPEVDSDPSAFAWGVPDLDSLRQFLMATIGWSQERADEILVPVIRDMNRRENEGTQANITQFFAGGVGVGGRAKPGAAANGAPSGNGAFAPRRKVLQKSQRMESALGRLHAQARHRTLGGGDEAEEVGAAQEMEGEGARARGATAVKGASRRKRAAPVVEEGEEEEEGGDSAGDGDEDEAPKRAVKRRKGRGKGKGKTMK